MNRNSELWTTVEHYGGFAGLRKLDVLHLVAEFLDLMIEPESWGPEPGFPTWVHSPNVWRPGAVRGALEITGLKELSLIFDEFQNLLPDGFRGLFGVNGSENRRHFGSPAAREINDRAVKLVAENGDEFAERVMLWLRSQP